ncbi:MAG: hypothetical protein ACXWWD_05240 [Chitinophagaceae bacterium]
MRISIIQFYHPLNIDLFGLLFFEFYNQSLWIRTLSGTNLEIEMKSGSGQNNYYQSGMTE